MARAAAAGSLPTDTPDERLRKSALVLSSLLITALAFVWVATYAALGLWRSALIPLAYQVVSLLGLALFARTKRYDLYRASQVLLILVLPFLLQWSLGGFVESGAVALWAFVAPLGALVFYGPRPAVGWFCAFAALVGVSAAIDHLLPAPDPPIPTWLVLVVFRAQRARPVRDDVRAPRVLRPLPRPRLRPAGRRAGALRAAPPQHLPATRSPNG